MTTELWRTAAAIIASLSFTGALAASAPAAVRAPDTTITSGPSGEITQTDAQFSFTASISGSSFQCKLDGAGWGGCKAPKSYSNLAPGSHLFEVRAKKAGRVDPTPATRSFTVNTAQLDTVKPEVTLTEPTDGTAVTTSQPSFSGGAGDAAGDETLVRVRIFDSGGANVMTLDATRSGTSWSIGAGTDLSAGTYTAYARQADAAGNVGYSPTIDFTISLATAESTEDCGWGTFSGLNHPPACWRPYADTSPFNVGVPASPRLVSNSSAIVERTVNFGTGAPVFTGGIADTDHDYGHPIYYPQPSDPVYTIHCRRWTSSCELEGVQVRIPAQARPAGGSDAHMTVIDQATGWEYGMWETESLPPGGGDLYIGHGGMTRIGEDGRGSNANAALFGLAAGVIRPNELEAGEINHALVIAVKCTNGTSVWPADSNTGRSCDRLDLPNENAPAMGQHFFLAMSDAEIDALSIPTWKKTVLRAIARYGMFVEDTGCSYRGWCIGLESGSSYTSFGQADPWVALAQNYGIPKNSYGHYDFDLRTAVDWQSKLRVADSCVSRRTC